MICAHLAEARFLETISKEILHYLGMLIDRTFLPHTTRRMFEAYIRSSWHKTDTMCRSIHGFSDSAICNVLEDARELGKRLMEQRMTK